MKFGKFYESNKINKFNNYYIDYKKLKNIIEDNEDSKLFYKLIDLELEKINLFVEIIKNNSKNNENNNENNNSKNNENNYINNDINHNNYSKLDSISNFLMMNYMALFKAIKKHDKKLCKSTKIDFFINIQKTPFYKYYLNLPRISKETKLVIFDKDGTLIKLHKIFGDWLIKLASKLSNFIDNEICFYEYLGFNIDNRTFSCDSVVAKGTNTDLKNKIVEYINNNLILDVEDIRNKIEEKWIDIELIKEDIELCGDIENIFKYLKNKGLHIAICTSDDREPTEQFLKMFDLIKYISSVGCGNDDISSKPSPEPIWKICSDLNIKPENTMMVGDTISDVHAGINAKCGKVIGVLSGGYDNTELNNADLIVNSIDNLESIII